MQFRSWLKWIVGMAALAALLTFAPFLARPGFAQTSGTTIPGGTINADTTWTLANSPYRVTGPITVVDGVTLTVEPGVEVIVNRSVSFTLHGAINAVGSAGSPIIFRGAESGRGVWSGLIIGSGTIVADSDSSRLSYVTVSNGGANGGGILLLNGVLPTQLDNLTIRESSTDGFASWNGGAFTLDTALIENNTRHGFAVYGAGRQILRNITTRNNDDSGVWLTSASGGQFQPTRGGQIISNLTTSGNRNYGLLADSASAPLNWSDSEVRGNGVAAQLPADSTLSNITWRDNTRAELEFNSGAITSAKTWANQPGLATYRLLASITVADNVTLTVEPGVEVLANRNISIQVNGAINAVGTASSPITFRGAESGRGAWAGLTIGGGAVTTDSNSSRLSYVNVRGGGANSTASVVITSGAAPVQLDNLTIRESSNDGIAGVNAGVFTLDTALIEDNTRNGFAVYGVGRQILRNITTRNNNDSGVWLGSVVAGLVQPNSGGQTISNLTTSGNRNYGLLADRFGAPLNWSDSEVRGNGVAAQVTAPATLSNITWRDNTRAELELNGGTLTTPKTWDIPPGLTAYRVLGPITVADNTTLTIEPGVTVLIGPVGATANSGVSLTINGALQAVGTAAAPITLRPDNSAGRGLWAGVVFMRGNNVTDGNASRLSHITIANGGSSVDMLRLDSVTPAQFENITLRNSGSGGLNVISTGAMTLTNVLVENSVGFGVVFQGTGGQTVTNLTSRNNGGYGVSVNAVIGGRLVANSGGQTFTNLTLSGNGSDGLYTDSSLSLTLTGATITGNQGAAIRHASVNLDMRYTNLTVSGNGTDAVVMAGGGLGIIGMQPYWDVVDIPILINGNLVIGQSVPFTIAAGTTLRFAPNTRLEVSFGSVLTAVGAPDQPVRFLGQSDAPGAWGGISVVGNTASVVLVNCEIGNGGGGRPMLFTRASNTSVLQSRLFGSAGDAIEVTGDATPAISFNRIEGNAFGVRNSNAGNVAVDARGNWWGDPSGPFHPTRNPNGLGNAVSDRVIFDPWLTEPGGGVGVTDLTVILQAPGSISPGETINYALVYANPTDQVFEDVVVLLDLPSQAFYGDSTNGGIYWPERDHAFWRLGDLAPGASGVVSLRTTFFWGLAANTEYQALALIGSTSRTDNSFDIQSYLDYQDTQLVARTGLTPAEVEAERQANPDLERFYQEALTKGQELIATRRDQLDNGEETVIMILRTPLRTAMTIIWRTNDIVQSAIVENGVTTLRDARDVELIFDRARDSVVEAQYSTRIAGVNGDVSTQTDPNFGTCLRNCLLKVTGKKLLSKIAMFLTADIRDARFSWLSPGDLLALKRCAADCDRDPQTHVCTQDYRFCDDITAFGRVAASRIMNRRCNTETGLYFLEPEFVSQCELNVATCMIGADGQPACFRCDSGGSSTQNAMLALELELNPEAYFSMQAQAAASAQPTASSLDELLANSKDDGMTVCATLAGSPFSCDLRRTSVRTGRDPNIKFGPAGDLVPGQTVPYTITYENIGAGIAFGVYITDQLSEHFDETTLVINGPGVYLPSVRTILWDIGELAPQGQPGSTGMVSYTVRLRPTTPGGTTIINQATVFFPSVPETTPTNAVVSVVAPVAGIPQQLTVEAGRPLNIRLTGREPAGLPLTFEVVDGPAFGSISGVAPSLTYTADINFSGFDRISFVASNGVTTSRPADILIEVLPSPNDRSAPTVRWTAPQDGAELSEDSPGQLGSDERGPYYGPMVIVGFSEPLDATTVTPEAVRLEREDGALILADVVHVEGEVRIVPREPLAARWAYTVALAGSLSDRNGNPLGEDYRFGFRIGPVVPPPDTTITAGPEALTNSATASFSFTGSGGMGALTFECSLDGADFAPCSSPATYSNLADGVRTLAVRAVDTRRVADSTPAEQTWTIDTLAPLTTIAFSGEAATACGPDCFFERVTVTFSVSEPATTIYQVNGGAEQRYSGPFTLEGVGTYAITFRSTDAAGNAEAPRSATAQVVARVAAPVILDDFNRADGRIGGAWLDSTQTDQYRIAGNRLDIEQGGPLRWNQAFGADQEAFMTITTLDTRGRHHTLMLKARGVNAADGAILVSYDARSLRINVDAFVPGQGWKRAGFFAQTLTAGAQLRAQALADGTVRVFVNGVALGAVDTKPVAGNRYGDSGGFIGLWFQQTSRAVIDDFGGGDVQP